jgi:hypothetical protein
MHPFAKTIATALLALLVSSPAWAELIHFTAHLSTAAEVPTKTGPGAGVADATLDTANSMFTYTIRYSGLSGPATAAHFHGPANTMETAGVAIKIEGGLSSPIKGETHLTHEQINDLMQGRWYVNVHTASNPSGEIRGQLKR